MHTDKKIFPVLYPLNRDLSKRWFIKYKVQCYTTGALVSRKYTGALNLIPDLQQRIELAEKYMAAIKRGEKLPDLQGQRTPSELHQPKSFASAIACTMQYLSTGTHGLRHATLLDYRCKCTIFCKWLQSSGHAQMTIGALSAVHVKEFMHYLKTERKLSNTTANDYKHTLSTVWQTFVVDGKITANPWKMVKDLRNDTQHMPAYTPEVERTISTYLPQHHPQLWLFLQFVYYCSIRPRRELRLLKVENIDFENGTITVPGSLAKNYKARTVIIPNVLLKQIMHWQQYPLHYYLFSKEGTPGAVRTGLNYFGYKFEDFRKAYNIPTQYKLYASKHTNNRKMAMLFNAVVLQHHNGHSSLSETQKYIGEMHWRDLEFLRHQIPQMGKLK